ncbi:MAG: filamentation induced by cAMP protein Fic [Acidimicrobiales bacterium]|nr:filamentation induced by cAMP protein Fic [Acidimicrobiales bacterium]
MSKVVRRRWQSSLDSGRARRDRRGCEYEAYVPDLLADRRFRIDGDVAADVADAEAAIRRLNSAATALVDTEALARLLLRAESVASSHIEGLVIGGRRLLRAEAAREMDAGSGDVTAEEVLRNIEAMSWAVEGLAASRTITVKGLLEVHRRLLTGTRLDDHAGRVRDDQNWIGGSSFNPCSAAFVPPPPEHIDTLLADLCAFVDDDALPAVVQAAVAHAQFETIHPFVDGNGRTGRALIHVILRRRGLAPRMLPPISLVLATWSRSYIEGLTATRYRGRSDSSAAHEGLNEWVARFAAACRRAVDDATAFEARVADIERKWHVALGRVRAKSAVELLLGALPGAPIVSVGTAAELIGRSFQATNEAMRRLEAAGVVHPITVARRNRAYEAKAIVDAFTALERQLASPTGDTRAARPQRPAPARAAHLRTAGA